MKELRPGLDKTNGRVAKRLPKVKATMAEYEKKPAEFCDHLVQFGIRLTENDFSQAVCGRRFFTNEVAVRLCEFLGASCFDLGLEQLYADGE